MARGLGNIKRKIEKYIKSIRNLGHTVSDEEIRLFGENIKYWETRYFRVIAPGTTVKSDLAIVRNNINRRNAAIAKANSKKRDAPRPKPKPVPNTTQTQNQSSGGMATTGTVRNNFVIELTDDDKENERIRNQQMERNKKKKKSKPKPKSNFGPTISYNLNKNGNSGLQPRSNPNHNYNLRSRGNATTTTTTAAPVPMRDMNIKRPRNAPKPLPIARIIPPTAPPPATVAPIPPPQPVLRRVPRPPPTMTTTRRVRTYPLPLANESPFVRQLRVRLNIKDGRDPFSEIKVRMRRLRYKLVGSGKKENAPPSEMTLQTYNSYMQNLKDIIRDSGETVPDTDAGVLAFRFPIERGRRTLNPDGTIRRFRNPPPNFARARNNVAPTTTNANTSTAVTVPTNAATTRVANPVQPLPRSRDGYPTVFRAGLGKVAPRGLGKHARKSRPTIAPLESKSNEENKAAPPPPRQLTTAVAATNNTNSNINNTSRVRTTAAEFMGKKNIEVKIKNGDRDFLRTVHTQNIIMNHPTVSIY
jgi:hypothetical protein